MDRHTLTAEQVADRLGVKVETVYAYVSRGLLTSVRAPGGRSSLFAAEDVDQLARRAARGRTPKPAAGDVATSVTLIRDGQLYFRGRPAVELMNSHAFESVAHFLWTGALDGEIFFAADPDALTVARAASAALPTRARTLDRIRVAVAAAAATDPLRFGTDPESVVAVAGPLIALMTQSLPLKQDEAGPSIAERLWCRLTDRRPDPRGLAALDGALVLLADHDLAASTFAARIAASVRADPYAVVQAGLGALDGPLHGLASSVAYRMLAEAEAGDPLSVLAERLRSGSPVPGCGHSPKLYPEGDARAVALFGLLGEDQGVVRELIPAMARRPGGQPNIDLALAALARAYGMPADAGEVIFAIARTAGWIAHALEEYEAAPNRFRPTGRYVGTEPPA